MSQRNGQRGRGFRGRSRGRSRSPGRTFSRPRGRGSFAFRGTQYQQNGTQRSYQNYNDNRPPRFRTRSSSRNRSVSRSPSRTRERSQSRNRNPALYVGSSIVQGNENRRFEVVTSIRPISSKVAKKRDPYVTIKDYKPEKQTAFSDDVERLAQQTRNIVLIAMLIFLITPVDAVIRAKSRRAAAKLRSSIDLFSCESFDGKYQNSVAVLKNDSVICVETWTKASALQPKFLVVNENNNMRYTTSCSTTGSFQIPSRNYYYDETPERITPLQTGDSKYFGVTVYSPYSEGHSDPIMDLISWTFQVEHQLNLSRFYEKDVIELDLQIRSNPVLKIHVIQSMKLGKLYTIFYPCFLYNKGCSAQRWLYHYGHCPSLGRVYDEVQTFVPTIPVKFLDTNLFLELEHGNFIPKVEDHREYLKIIAPRNATGWETVAVICGTKTGTVTIGFRQEQSIQKRDEICQVSWHNQIIYKDSFVKKYAASMIDLAQSYTYVPVRQWWTRNWIWVVTIIVIVVLAFGGFILQNLYFSFWLIISVKFFFIRIIFNFLRFLFKGVFFRNKQVKDDYKVAKSKFWFLNPFRKKIGLRSVKLQRGYLVLVLFLFLTIVDSTYEEHEVVISEEVCDDNVCEVDYDVIKQSMFYPSNAFMVKAKTKDEMKMHSVHVTVSKLYLHYIARHIKGTSDVIVDEVDVGGVTAEEIQAYTKGAKRIGSAHKTCCGCKVVAEKCHMKLTGQCGDLYLMHCDKEVACPSLEYDSHNSGECHNLTFSVNPKGWTANLYKLIENGVSGTLMISGINNQMENFNFDTRKPSVTTIHRADTDVQIQLLGFKNLEPINHPEYLIVQSKRSGLQTEYFLCENRPTDDSFDHSDLFWNWSDDENVPFVERVNWGRVSVQRTMSHIVGSSKYDWDTFVQFPVPAFGDIPGYRCTKDKKVMYLSTDMIASQPTRDITFTSPRIYGEISLRFKGLVVANHEDVMYDKIISNVECIHCRGMYLDNTGFFCDIKLAGASTACDGSQIEIEGYGVTEILTKVVTLNEHCTFQIYGYYDSICPSKDKTQPNKKNYCFITGKITGHRNAAQFSCKANLDAPPKIEEGNETEVWEITKEERDFKFDLSFFSKIGTFFKNIWNKTLHFFGNIGTWIFIGVMVVLGILFIILLMNKVSFYPFLIFGIVLALILAFFIAPAVATTEYDMDLKFSNFTIELYRIAMNPVIWMPIGVYENVKHNKKPQHKWTTPGFLTPCLNVPNNHFSRGHVLSATFGGEYSLANCNLEVHALNSYFGQWENWLATCDNKRKIYSKRYYFVKRCIEEINFEFIDNEKEGDKVYRKPRHFRKNKVFWNSPFNEEIIITELGNSNIENSHIYDMEKHYFYIATYIELNVTCGSELVAVQGKQYCNGTWNATNTFLKNLYNKPSSKRPPKTEYDFEDFDMEEVVNGALLVYGMVRQPLRFSEVREILKEITTTIILDQQVHSFILWDFAISNPLIHPRTKFLRTLAMIITLFLGSTRQSKNFMYQWRNEFFYDNRDLIFEQDYERMSNELHHLLVEDNVDYKCYYKNEKVKRLNKGIDQYHEGVIDFIEALNNSLFFNWQSMFRSPYPHV